MTIFRFSALLLTFFAAACAKNAAPADTELGRITSSNQDYRSAAAQLQRFAEARLAQPSSLNAEFLRAGFKHSAFKDGPDSHCEAYQLQRSGVFPSVYRVTICDGKVFADAGQLAP